MTDNKEKGNFWVGLTGIITALLGSGGLVALIQTFKPTNSTNPSLPPTHQVESIKTETLEIYADSTKGIKYTNKENKSVQIKFKAKGTWLAIPENTTGVPDDAKGYLSAKGDPNFIPNKTPCTAPLGALIIMGEDGKCKAYGEQGTFDLEAPGSVYFLMNDVSDLYGDNKGFITVTLSIPKN